MASIEEIISSGRLIFSAYSGGFDTTAKDAPTTYKIKKLMKDVIINYFGYWGDIHIYPNNKIEEYELTCYGRPCLVISSNGGDIVEEPVSSIANIDGLCSLCCRDSNNSLVEIEHFFGFDNTGAGYTHDYSGTEEYVFSNIIPSRAHVNIFNGGLAFPTGNEQYGIRINLHVNIPVFLKHEHAEDYIRTGNTANVVNMPEEEPTFKKPEVYYYTYTESIVKDSDNSTISKNGPVSALFKLPNVNDVVAWVKISDDYYELQSTSNTVLVFDDDTKYYTKEVSFDTVHRFIYNSQHDNQNGTYTSGDIETNIQFVNDLSYIVPNYDDPLKPSNNGIDSKMPLNEVSVAVSFTKAYYLNADEVNNIGKILFYNDETFIETLKKGLWMYNENPIDCVIDLCYYPIDISVFISSDRNTTLNFGAFVYNGEVPSVQQKSYRNVTGTNKTFNLINQRIKPIYNDFRDIDTVSYQLFLPYYGLIQLDNMIVNKTLRVDAKFDIYTSQLKYYIFVNDSLYTCVECGIGRHISVLGTDWISKSNKNLNSMISYFGNTASNIASASINPVGSVTNQIFNSIDVLKTNFEKPNVTTAGSSTTGLNIYDPRSCYLIVEQYETIKPNNLSANYGVPTYYISALNKCSGYTIVNDVKLKTRALENEQNEIINLLSTGIII